jgi:hypothetical protein
MIDGGPILVIATGLEDGGSNSKTGPMVQIYIIRADQNPLRASQVGDDVSICGSCVHRGIVIIDPKTGKRKNVKRSCYVTLMHGPRVVWDAYQRGVYQEVSLTKARKLLARKRCRIGAYGDPGAVPIKDWKTALAQVDELTGYTHLWREYPELAASAWPPATTRPNAPWPRRLASAPTGSAPRGSPRLLEKATALPLKR